MFLIRVRTDKRILAHLQFWYREEDDEPTTPSNGVEAGSHFGFQTALAHPDEETNHGLHRPHTEP